MQAQAAARQLHPACAAPPGARRVARPRRGAPARASGQADEGGSAQDSPAAAAAGAPFDVPPPSALGSVVSSDVKQGAKATKSSVWDSLQVRGRGGA